jgi:hypothetical protein
LEPWDTLIQFACVEKLKKNNKLGNMDATKRDGVTESLGLKMEESQNGNTSNGLGVAQIL